MRRSNRNVHDKKRYYSTMLRDSQIKYLRLKSQATGLTQAQIIENAILILQAQDMQNRTYPTENDPPEPFRLSESDHEQVFEEDWTSKESRILFGTQKKIK